MAAAPASQQLGIAQLMHEAQAIVDDNGLQFVSWGALTVTGLLFTYLAVALRLPPSIPAIVWAILLVLGWLQWVWWGRRAHSRARVHTMTTRLVGSIWTSVGLALTALFLASVLWETLPAAALPGVVSSLLGIAYFACAPVYPKLPLRLLASLWWLGALLLFAWSGAHTLLVMAGMVLVLQVVPGIRLWRERPHRSASP